MNLRLKLRSMGWLLGALALGAGCDEESEPRDHDAVDSGAETDEGDAGASEGEDGGETDAALPPNANRFVLGAITISPSDNKRVSFAQLVEELDGAFTNKDGIEVPGNAVFLSRGSDFFYGLAESPEWVRYSTKGGQFKETGRLSFLNYGITYMDFSNVIVDDDTAVSVLTEAYTAVIWNPTTMTIKGTIDLSYLEEKDFSLESFPAVTHDGLVYVPAKWVNWESAHVMQKVHVSVLDPKQLKVIAKAEDDRCGAAGSVTFDAKGYAYVMGDGRNQSMQVFAESHGEKSVPNCLLRIAPGQDDFEEDFFFTIPQLTGGLDSMAGLETAVDGSGVAFSTIYYKDRLPPGLDMVNFEHWSEPVFKRWRFTLGDEPSAEEVEGANFSVLGFSCSPANGKLYCAESEDGTKSTVFELDPETNTAVEKFTMDGYFGALLPIYD